MTAGEYPWRAAWLDTPEIQAAVQANVDAAPPLTADQLDLLRRTNYFRSATATPSAHAAPAGSAAGRVDANAEGIGAAEPSDTGSLGEVRADDRSAVANGASRAPSRSKKAAAAATATASSTTRGRDRSMRAADARSKDSIA